MDHFVMTQHQHEMLMVGVEHREGDLTLMMLPVDRRTGNVAERVVHPSHVPLETEAQPSLIDGLGNSGPCRRFLGDRHDSGMACVAGGVEGLQELDRLEILPTSEAVRDPLPSLARVVEVKHGGHGIHAKTVDMVLVEPEEGIGDQEVPDLVTSVVEN